MSEDVLHEAVALPLAVGRARCRRWSTLFRGWCGASSGCRKAVLKARAWAGRCFGSNAVSPAARAMSRCGGQRTAGPNTTAGMRT